MADYYNIIKKTLGNLGETTPQLREKIFDSARKTIHKQLQGAGDLSQEVIDQHLNKLEDAIGQIKVEHGDVAQAPIVNEDVAPQNAPPQEETTVQAPAQATVQAPAQATPAQPTSVEPAVAEQPQPEQNTIIEQPNLPQANRDEPHPVLMPSEDQQANAGDLDLSIPDIPESDAQFASKSKGNLSKTIFSILLLIIIAVLGYFGWQNKDGIMKMLESNADTTEQVEVVEETPIAEEKIVKNEVRLGSNGEELKPQPLAPSTDSQEITAEELTQSNTNSSNADTSAENTVQTTNEAVPEAKQEEAQKVEATATDTAPQAVATTSKVLFYEEGGTTNEGKRFQGNITWELKQESIADGLPEEPVIHATISIPENGLKLLLNIKRNLDKALAASHMVELIFSVPDDFSGRQIEDARSLVFKPTEQARGVALIGVPVKVSDGIFLIALSNVDNAKKQNLEILKRLEWIDIPLKYETARRALISFQKDEAGKKTFDDALSAWEKLSS